MKKLLFALVALITMTSFVSDNKRATFAVTSATSLEYGTKTRLNYALAGGDNVHNYTVSWKIVMYSNIANQTYYTPNSTYVHIATLTPSNNYTLTREYYHFENSVFDHIEIISGPNMIID